MAETTKMKINLNKIKVKIPEFNPDGSMKMFEDPIPQVVCKSIYSLQGKEVSEPAKLSIMAIQAAENKLEVDGADFKLLIEWIKKSMIYSAGVIGQIVDQLESFKVEWEHAKKSK